MTIEVKNASFSYDGKQKIFENIEFTVDQGEVLSILGPNGCGKTTLLKTINALHKLEGGEVILKGKNIRALKRNEIGKGLGYVTQVSDSTFPYSVLEMVLMGRAPHMMMFASPSNKDKEIARNALVTLGISHLTYRPYNNLSGGQAQLVLIARALASEPWGLLLDEPTSHLDFRNQMVILNTLEMLAAEKNITIIMTTHYPDHAFSISQRALLMGDGLGGITGSIEEVLSEKNLEKTFNINIKIATFSEQENTVKIVVPLRKSSLMKV